MSLAYYFQIIIYKICSKTCETDVLGIYSNGYKTDILDNYLLLAILCCMLVLSLLASIFKIIKNFKFPRLASIRLGYYYANKADGHYFANRVCKILQKDLNIKDITPAMVMSDFYSSTKFGPLYYYRNIRGFLKRSILFFLIRIIIWIGGLFIFLHRTHNLSIDLDKYSVSLWSVELSALTLMESFCILHLVLWFGQLVLKLWTIRDRHVSIYNVKTNLLPRLSKSQRFYFRLGVAIYSVSSRLIIIGQVIFIYLLLCQLDLISPFIKVDQVFEFIDYISDYTLKSWGFEIKMEKDEATSSSPRVEKCLYVIDRLIGFAAVVILLNSCLRGV